MNWMQIAPGGQNSGHQAAGWERVKPYGGSRWVSGTRDTWPRAREERGRCWGEWQSLRLRCKGVGAGRA